MSPRTQKTQKVAKHERSESSIKNSSSHSRRSSKQSSDQPSDSELKTGQDAERAFAKIGVRELLEFDPRPTFVLDLIAYGERDEEEEVDFEPLYCNSAFLSNDNLTAELLSKRKSELPPDESQLEFKRWTNVRASGISRPRAFQYRDILWTGFIVGGRWRVISGTPISHIKEALIDSPTILTEAGKDLKETYDGSAEPVTNPTKSETSSPSPPESIYDEAPEMTGEYHNLGTPDWTVPHPTGYITPHMHFARNVNWASTALGDMSTWSPELRQLVNLLMVNPHPAAIYWGEEYTMIYNEQYAINVAGRKHPTLMGTGFRKAFVEIKTLVGSLFTHAMRTGQAVAQVEQMLPIERFGFLEETYYSWSLIPVYGGTGSIQGLWNTPIETTRQTIADRRTRTLLQLGEEVSLATSVPSFWSRILKPLEANEFDFPFALLYSVLDDVEGDEVSSISSESSHTMKSCVLEGMLGVPVDSEAAPAKLDLKRARGGFVPAFRDAMRTREPTILNILDGTLPESLIKGFEWRGFGEPCKQAVVCPIRPTTGETVLGFLVVGINPRRAWDADYQTFIRLLNRQLATSLASVTLFEAEIKRGSTAAEAAALERMKLSEELAVQRSRMQRMAEVSPVGMFSIDPQGLLLEANDRWFEQTGHPRDTLYEMSWMEVIDPSSVPIVEDGWKRLTVDGLPWSAELKLKKRWHDPNLENHELIDHWILAASQPEFAPDGTLKSIMGCITDITLQKQSAQDAMTRAKLSEELLLRTQEAKENEKNFKRFTDIVPGGLFIMDAEQRITYANSQWFSISGYPKTDVSDAPLSWSLAILEDDLPEYNSKWEQMITEYSTITTEVRMRAPAKIEFGGRLLDVQRWILASAIPEVSEDGSLRSVMGCITDISRIKWAEGLQNRRLLEAEENRRQQNNFIDITSHEMRNPLSAILQCADGISSSLTEYKASQPVLNDLLLEAIDSCIEAAETIQLCAQHQKSIVDDILTISKLDSDLLLITPVPIRPIEVVRQSLKMFVAECQMNRIDMKFHIDGSFEALKLGNVMLDSSRLLQVLINLLTNAIKFTKSEAIRSIDVGISAHLGPPHEQNPKFDYFPTNKAKADVTAGNEWGTGEIIYLRFEVKDTGCGLTSEEKNKLFTRFSQASPRTHIQYGGSGLGLFISRQLTELQGGEIGVASESGVGSTFAFYLKSRRVEQEVSTESMNSRLQLDLQSQSRLVTNVPMNVGQGETTTSVSKLLQAVDLTRSPTATPPVPVSPGDLYVLIVEDNLVNQRILAAQIKKLGCVVYVANHGGEALEVLKETKYFKGRELDGKDLSVILMDLEMPVMDGLTCVRAIREMQTQGLILGHVPIIAVTANARGEQIATAKDSGMDDVMPKPFRIRQLIPKIEALLQKTAAMNAS